MTAKRKSSLWILSTLALSMLMSSVGVSITNVALPTLTKVFAASFATVQWIILVYLLLITIMIVNVGRLGDMIGRRRLLLVGMLLYTNGAIGCALAPALWALIVARALQGVGAAALMALTIAMVSEAVAEDKIGGAMGLMGAMSAIGTTIGPALGGVMIAAAGWRSIFGSMALLGVLNLILAYRFLPRNEQKRSSTYIGFDVGGIILLAVALACYSLAMTLGVGRFSRLNFVLLAAAILSASLFVVVEKRASSPLVPMALLRSRILKANLAMNAMVSTVMMTTLVVGPFYLSRALGLNSAQVGMVMSIGPIFSALSGFPAGRMVDHLGASKVVLIGLTEMTLGAAALTFLPERYGVLGYIASVAILSPGYQLFQAANNTAIMSNVENSQRGVVAGILSLSRNLGLVTGAAVMGAVFSSATGTGYIESASPKDVSTGMQHTFMIAAALVLVTIGLQLASKRQSFIDSYFMS